MGRLLSSLSWHLWRDHRKARGKTEKRPRNSTSFFFESFKGERNVVTVLVIALSSEIFALPPPARCAKDAYGWRYTRLPRGR